MNSQLNIKKRQLLYFTYYASPPHTQTCKPVLVSAEIMDQETKSPWILVVNLTQFDCMTLNDINSNPWLSASSKINDLVYRFSNIL